MVREKVDYLIIGNGISGLSAANEIRKNDEKGNITIVSKEHYLTYYRVKLTEYICKDFKEEDLLVNKKDWYKEKNINVILGKIVEEVDFNNNLIKLDDGVLIEYKKLLLATGSRPFIPPIAGKFKKGVFALRSIKDLKDIQEYLLNCKNVTIIGGGLLGLEAAWAVKQLNKEVNIVEFAPYLLPKQLDEELSKKLSKKLEKLGFNIYLDSAAEEILGESKVSELKISGGRTFETDSILISSGIRPNLDLVRDTELKFNKGIIVDKYLRTNMPNVYAAGDVVEVDSTVLGLWTVGNEQGKIAGLNMVGGTKEYTLPEPYTRLEIGDIKLFSVGDINGFDKIYEYKKGEEIHHKLFTTNGKITGGILFGDIKDMFKLRKAILDGNHIENFELS